MKGKKVNTEFLCNFISECVDNNKFTTEVIVQEAKNRIDKIDKKILEVEKLKIERSNLLDVVCEFNKIKKNKEKEIENLSLINVGDLNICKFICDAVDCSPISENLLLCQKKYNNQDFMFNVKRLLKHEIISKSADIVSKGDNYYKYVTERWLNQPPILSE